MPWVPRCGCRAQPGASTRTTGGPGASNPHGVPRLSAATSLSPGSARCCVRRGPGRGCSWAVLRMLRQVCQALGWISRPCLMGRWVMPSVCSTARCCGTAQRPLRPAASASAQLGIGKGVTLPGEFSTVKAFAAEAEQIQHCSPAEILPRTQVILQLFVSLMKWSHFLLPDVPTAKCLENAFPGERSRK